MYFCDESSFIDDRYMAVGGLAIARGRIGEIDRKLKEIRRERGGWGEIKWNNTAKHGLGVRKAYIDYLAGLVSRNIAHFHVRFAPFDEYDHDASGKRRRFDTVSKMYYQLLLHRPVRYYGPKCQVQIRPDDGECTSELKKFKSALHIDGGLKYNCPPTCIDDIICLNSEKEPLLQFLDVAVGSLSAFRNERHLLANTAAAKRELAEYAAKAFNIGDISKSLDRGKKFSIWNVVPKKRDSSES